MTLIRRFILFWYQFIVGDDWIAALMVFTGFAGTYLMVRAGNRAFWVLPLVLLLSMTISLYRLARLYKRKS